MMSKVWRKITEEKGTEKLDFEEIGQALVILTHNSEEFHIFFNKRIISGKFFNSFYDKD